MLVLSRKLMERVNIGDSVIVTVLGIRGRKVRIGMEAPKEVHVLRTELQSVMPRPPTDVVAAAVASIKS